MLRRRNRLLSLNVITANQLMAVDLPRMDCNESL